MATRMYSRAGCAITVVVFGLFVWFVVKHAILVWRMAHAETLTAHIEELREKAIQASPAEAAQELEIIIGFYPSGTVQVEGSPLDRMVERVRRSAIREIIAHLRAVTKEDLGDDPWPWVARYRKDH